MPEPGLLRLERRGLADLRRHRLDLAHLVGEQIQHAFPVPSGLLQRLELPPGGLQTRVRAAIGRDLLDVLGPGVPVEEGRLGAAVEQPKRLMLPVDLHETGAHVGERGRGGELAADPRRPTAVGHERARQDQLAVLRPLLRPGRRVEPRLDLGRPLARSDELGASPAAQRQRNTDRDHRLAGARLAREDGEPAGGLDVELADHAETGDVQLPKHERILAPDTDTAEEPLRSSSDPTAHPAGRTSRGRGRGTPAPPAVARTVPGAPTRGCAPPHRPATRSCPPVGREEAGLITDDLQGDELGGVEDDRAVEHHVRRHRRHDQRLDRFGDTIGPRAENE